MKNSRFKRIVVITVLMATTATAYYAWSEGDLDYLFDDFYDYEYYYYAGVNFLGDFYEYDDSIDVDLETAFDGASLDISWYSGSTFDPEGLSLYLSRDDWYFDPLSGLGDGTIEVPTRIDNEATETWTWEIFGSDIPDMITIQITDRQVVRKLKKADRLEVQVTPTMGKPKTLVFPIAGLEQALDIDTWLAVPQVERYGKPREREALRSLIRKLDATYDVDNWEPGEE